MAATAGLAALLQLHLRAANKRTTPHACDALTEGNKCYMAGDLAGYQKAYRLALPWAR